MSPLNFFQDAYKRSFFSHILIIVILIVNILLFSTSLESTIIQSLLIIIILLHNKDNINLKNKFENSANQLREDANIFDRNIIVSESDVSGIITYVNPKFCEISGYSKEELLGQPHSIIKDPEAPDRIFKELWQTITSGETYYGVLKNIRKDGTPYWVDVSISPIVKNTKTVGYKAIRFDITNQTLLKENLKYEIDKKENLLKHQISRFEFVINSSRDGFWDYDVQNKKFYLSSGWKKRLGFKEDEIVSYLKYISLIPDEDRYKHHQAMHDMLDKHPPSESLEHVHFRIRYTLITKAGEKILIEDVGDAVLDKNQTPTRITGFHRDITEQERQTKLIESQNRLASMGEMIGNIAHQWRQPIGAINNVLNDVEFDIELEELKEIKVQQYLDVSKKVKDYTAHLSKTIDDFRNISSNEKVKSEFFIKDVLGNAYKIVSTEYEKNSINFKISCIDNCDYKLIGYERELMQVVLNILNNAKDILLQKDISTPRVLISFTKDKSNIVITIHDNAGGIPNAIKEKIFDPYFTTKHESVGTGIGLYMSKKIILEHFNGSLNVENENNGAKFVITLPDEKAEN